MRLVKALPYSILALILCVACGKDDPMDTDASTSSVTQGTVGPSTSPASDTAGETQSESESETQSETTGETDGTSVGTTDDPTTASTDDPSTSDTDPTTGDDGASFCLESCEDDSDCNLDGQDMGYTCGSNNLCTTDFAGCTDDEECQIQFSGWEFGDNCAAQADCAVTQACINLDGAGKCVYAPSDFLSCEDINQEEVQAPAIEGGQITVCKNTTALCTEAKFCINGCSSNADCVVPNFPVCNTQTNHCECGQDSDCAGLQGTSICAEGVCQCASDADCAPLDYADTCYEGSCGCSEDMTCENYNPEFDGTSVSCRGV